MAAYRDRHSGTLCAAAFLLYLAAALGLVGIVLWRLWETVTLW